MWRVILLAAALAPLAAEPMLAPSLAEGVVASSVVVADFDRCDAFDKATYFGGVATTYRVVQVLQGPAMTGEIAVMHAFHDGSACVEPKDWKPDASGLPAAGSRWVLLLTKGATAWETYRGPFGRRPIAELRLVLAAAPQSLSVAKASVALDPYLWRDFMPGPGSGEKPLYATLTLVVTGERPRAAPVIEAAWLIHGDDCWERAIAPAELEGERVVVRDAPAWPVGDAVDAVVRLRSQDGTAVLLRAPQRTIKRTD